MNYKDKYIKYKIKYINLKNIIEGGKGGPGAARQYYEEPAKKIVLDNLEYTICNHYSIINQERVYCDCQKYNNNNNNMRRICTTCNHQEIAHIKFS